MTNDRIVSARLVLGGHNFSQDSLPESIADGTRVVIDTPHAMLLPESVLRDDEFVPECWMRRSGFDIPDGCCVSVCSPLNGTVALVLLPDGMKEALHRRADGKWSMVSPLQEIVCTRRGINLLLEEHAAYVTVCDSDGLRFADSLPDKSADTLIYAIHCIGETLPDCGPVRVLGHGADGVTAALKPYFKLVVQCE